MNTRTPRTSILAEHPLAPLYDRTLTPGQRALACRPAYEGASMLFDPTPPTYAHPCVMTGLNQKNSSLFVKWHKSMDTPASDAVAPTPAVQDFVKTMGERCWWLNGRQQILFGRATRHMMNDLKTADEFWTTAGVKRETARLLPMTSAPFPVWTDRGVFALSSPDDWFVWQVATFAYAPLPIPMVEIGTSSHLLHPDTANYSARRDVAERSVKAAFGRSLYEMACNAIHGETSFVFPLPDMSAYDDDFETMCSAQIQPIKEAMAMLWVRAARPLSRWRVVHAETILAAAAREVNLGPT